jgi:hypothetical protein
MAIIPNFFVVAAEKTVATGQTSILEGQVVSLDSNGNVVLQSSTNIQPYGLAGDSKSTSVSSMPGVSSGWQGRASDYYDETKASGKMTVYHSGGEFATDQFAANVASASIMARLYGVNGVLDTVDTHSTSTVVAVLTKTAGSYPSGVPGVNINGDAALAGQSPSGTANNYIEIKLLI